MKRLISFLREKSSNCQIFPNHEKFEYPRSMGIILIRGVHILIFCSGCMLNLRSWVEVGMLGHLVSWVEFSE